MGKAMLKFSRNSSTSDEASSHDRDCVAEAAVEQLEQLRLAGDCVDAWG